MYSAGEVEIVIRAIQTLARRRRLVLEIVHFAWRVARRGMDLIQIETRLVEIIIKYSDFRESVLWVIGNTVARLHRSYQIVYLPQRVRFVVGMP